MSTQGSLFNPGEGGRETPTIQARILSRHDDPPTSKAAAARTARMLTESQDQALACLMEYGPGTTHELAAKAARLDVIGGADRATAIHHELARRLPELERAGLVRVTGEIRNGSRCWEIISCDPG